MTFQLESIYILEGLKVKNDAVVTGISGVLGDIQHCVECSNIQ